MNIQWGSLMRLSRRALNLTQEDFAMDFGRSQSMVAQWESGRKVIPQHMRRKILDILSGYYKKQPDFVNIKSIVDNFDGFSSIQCQGHRGLYGNNTFISEWYRKMNTEYIGANILAHLPQDAKILELAESHTLKMLDGKSDFVKIVVHEKSILFNNRSITRKITPINIGVGTVILLQEKLGGIQDPLPEKSWAIAITRDGTEERIGCW
jgi:transcriptional regulator with XRE-family HTH domain